MSMIGPQPSAGPRTVCSSYHADVPFRLSKLLEFSLTRTRMAPSILEATASCYQLICRGLAALAPAVCHQVKAA